MTYTQGGDFYDNATSNQESLIYFHPTLKQVDNYDAVTLSSFDKWKSEGRIKTSQGGKGSSEFRGSSRPKTMQKFKRTFLKSDYTTTQNK